jgi:hypothetical protein
LRTVELKWRTTNIEQTLRKIERKLVTDGRPDPENNRGEAITEENG